MNYFNWIYGTKQTVSTMDENTDGKSLPEMKKDLAEHKKTCVAKPGNCPYEKKLNTEIHKEEEKSEKADTLENSNSSANIQNQIIEAANKFNELSKNNSYPYADRINAKKDLLESMYSTDWISVGNDKSSRERFIDSLPTNIYELMKDMAEVDPQEMVSERLEKFLSDTGTPLKNLNSMDTRSMFWNSYSDLDKTVGDTYKKAMATLNSECNNEIKKANGEYSPTSSIEAIPQDKDDYNKWFASKLPTLKDDIMESGSFDETYNGQIENKIRHIMNNPYGYTEGDSYQEIVDNLAEEIANGAEEYRENEKDFYNELRAEQKRGK